MFILHVSCNEFFGNASAMLAGLTLVLQNNVSLCTTKIVVFNSVISTHIDVKHWYPRIRYGPGPTNTPRSTKSNIFNKIQVIVFTFRIRKCKYALSDIWIFIIRVHTHPFSFEEAISWLIKSNHYPPFSCPAITKMRWDISPHPTYNQCLRTKHLVQRASSDQGHTSIKPVRLSKWL